MFYQGDPKADILVVCDAPSKEDWQNGEALSGDALKKFAKEMELSGFGREDFCFVPPCPPVPRSAYGSDARENAHIQAHEDDFDDLMEEVDPLCVVTLGKVGTRAVSRKAVKITKARGRIQKYAMFDVPVLPMLSPQHVLRRPEMDEIFRADCRMLELLDDNEFDPEAAGIANMETNYRWCTDIRFLLDKVKSGEVEAIGLDTETDGLDWRDPNVKILTVQLSWEDGEAICLPMDRDYYPDISKRELAVLKVQLKNLLTNHRVVKIAHNFGFDHHQIREKLGYEVQGWDYDTQILAFLVDENMYNKSQDECVRRWVPPMAGYADEFNEVVDKSDMRSVPPEDLMQYGCGDADAVRRLCRVLRSLAQKEEDNWRCFEMVIWPSMLNFIYNMEPHGIDIDQDALEELQAALDHKHNLDYDDLIRMVPKKVRRQHAEKGLKFSRPAFLIDILFSKDGFDLEPRVFTKSTKSLPDDQKVPSTSAKDHLPYFEHVPFVKDLMDFQRLTKMRDTYVGRPEESIIQPDGSILDLEAKGFFKYIRNGRINPSFLLHRTVTGRTASANPNAQNFPKRGRGKMEPVVKAFRRLFRAPKGYTLVECDLSQIELRVAAWMANDRTMINLYRDGADIHAATAATTMGLNMEEFLKLGDDEKKMKRFQAKAVNFGYLYGMWWKGFKEYARTDYGIKLTDEEAQEIRERFFENFYGLLPWHREMREFVHQHGYVEALHGARRHLPSIYSSDESIVRDCERQAINAPVQRFASDLGLMGLYRMARDCPMEVIQPVAFIHDAMVLKVRDDYLDEAMAAAKFYMESVPLYEWFGLEPPLPIIAEAEHGPNLADMNEVKGLEAWEPDWYQYDLDMDFA